MRGEGDVVEGHDLRAAAAPRESAGSGMVHHVRAVPPERPAAARRAARRGRRRRSRALRSGLPCAAAAPRPARLASTTSTSPRSRSASTQALDVHGDPRPPAARRSWCRAARASVSASPGRAGCPTGAGSMRRRSPSSSSSPRSERRVKKRMWGDSGSGTVARRCAGVVSARRPPGRSTRRTSDSRSCTSRTCSIVSAHSTRSNEESASGSGASGLELDQLRAGQRARAPARGPRPRRRRPSRARPAAAS